ncbi:MAG: hypothetical protein ACI8WT_002551 [Clostridium sp.]|jgi:hypothetical protein
MKGSRECYIGKTGISKWNFNVSTLLIASHCGEIYTFVDGTPTGKVRRIGS